MVLLLTLLTNIRRYFLDIQIKFKPGPRTIMPRTFLGPLKIILFLFTVVKKKHRKNTICIGCALEISTEL